MVEEEYSGVESAEGGVTRQSRQNEMKTDRAHNPKVVGSSPAPATKLRESLSHSSEAFLF